ncbi:MAG: acetylxylan esterase [Actinobacteria bacterium]|nr:acetylxylan esterase [Actinomycetota bacterium]
MNADAPARFAFDAYVQAVDDAHRPALAYAAQPFAAWHATLRAKVMDLLGPLPARVALNAVIDATEEFPEYRQHHVVYQTAPGVEAPAYLLIPHGVDAARPAPAILALHGHGDGKGQLVARGEPPNLYASLARRYAEAGFVVLVPDAIGFGERAADFRRYGGRDGCNVNHLKLALFGRNLMALNIWDDMRGLDFLASRPDVDAARLGCAGLSFGGTRTMYLAALDERVRAALVSGYLTTFRAYAIDTGNFCGSQFLPGVYAWGDVADIHGLIAPRRLLIQAGRADRGFPIEASRAAHAHLARIYAAAGAADRLERDEFNGGHEVNPAPVVAFMQRWLGRDV